jgi:hypothetical protein
MTYARPMPADAPHGSLSTYVNYGCRCEPCRTANRENARRYRERQRRLADNGVLARLRPPGGWGSYGPREDEAQS